MCNQKFLQNSAQEDGKSGRGGSRENGGGEKGGGTGKGGGGQRELKVPPPGIGTVPLIYIYIHTDVDACSTVDYSTRSTGRSDLNGRVVIPLIVK